MSTFLEKVGDDIVLVQSLFKIFIEETPEHKIIDLILL